MDDFTDQVCGLQERWNSLIHDISADYKITCDEAAVLHQRIVAERKAYVSLRRQIHLDIRAKRGDYQTRLSLVQDHAVAKEMRLDLARTTYPDKKLLLDLDELVLKAEELSLRAERIIAQCEERQQRHRQAS